ncbi:MAG: electron transfer flavoprotein subunit alpha [Desulfobacterales bacterium GWB2_56_26]|nr:MAG: electron transfer flavoprotein subunit alpha [Desulfobacterales bacterium GWB2_56_26]
MKILLVAEYRQGKLLDNYTELLAFAGIMGAESVMFTVAEAAGALPNFDGRLYLAEVSQAGEYNPETHRQLLLDVVEMEQPEMIVLSHSSYGWDLAPRLAVALRAAQISEVVAVEDGQLVASMCNGKLRRTLKSRGKITVVTTQAGAFSPTDAATGAPTVIPVGGAASGKVKLLGYETAKPGGVDLARAEVIVSAGRGVGKPENVAMVANLAKALGGEYGASRPVVDSLWVEHNRQVGTTGHTVAPKLYIACGISGAVQHLAGMKKSEFVVAINTDRDAPIGDVADVFAVADLKQLLPILTEKLQAL